MRTTWRNHRVPRNAAPHSPRCAEPAGIHTDSKLRIAQPARNSAGLAEAYARCAGSRVWQIQMTSCKSLDAARCIPVRARRFTECGFTDSAGANSEDRSLKSRLQQHTARTRTVRLGRQLAARKLPYDKVARPSPGGRTPAVGVAPVRALCWHCCVQDFRGRRTRVSTEQFKFRVASETRHQVPSILPTRSTLPPFPTPSPRPRAYNITRLSMLY